MRITVGNIISARVIWPARQRYTDSKVEYDESKPEQAKNNGRGAVEQVNTIPDEAGDASFPGIFNKVNCDSYPKRKCNNDKHQATRYSVPIIAG